VHGIESTLSHGEHVKVEKDQFLLISDRKAHTDNKADGEELTITGSTPFSD